MCAVHRNNSRQAGELAQEAAARMTQAEEQQEAEAARKAMLREAAMLRDHLPPGTLRDDEEWRMMNEALSQQGTG